MTQKYTQRMSSSSSGFFTNSENEWKHSDKLTDSGCECYDVIIIGGGLSGLTTAFRLHQLKPGYSFKILEAKSRIGGRIYTTELPAANNQIDSWDLGGCWIGDKSSQPYINQLLADLDIKTYSQIIEGYKMLQVGKHKVTKYATSIPSMGFLSLFDVGSLMRSLDNTQKKLLDSEESLVEYDSITVGNLMQKRSWTKSGMDCVSAAFKSLFGSEMCKVSALFFFRSVNSYGGIVSALSSGASSSLTSFKIKGGSKTICSRILSIIGVDKIAKRSVVSSIIQKKLTMSDKSYLLVSTTSGISYKCKHVVLAIPPHLINAIQISPPISPNKYEYFTSSLPGHTIKVILTYEEAFWTKSGFSGEVITNGGPSHYEDCKSGPLCIVFDGSTSNKSPALIALICGSQALEYERKTKEERKEAVLKSLEEFFDPVAVRSFIVYCEKIWRQEPYVGGCPTASAPPGVARHLNQSIRSSENNIHFGGAELGRVWIGFMEGAVESGDRVALEILESN